MYSMSDDLLKMKQANTQATVQRSLEQDSLWALRTVSHIK
jgi:hypothetical protein